VGTNSHILWASILASTIVAAFTTLLVEYVAKPWLEVRKDRILESNQRQRSALRGLSHATTLAGRMIALRDLQSNPLAREQTMEFATEVGKCVTVAYEELTVPKFFGDDWVKATSITYTFSMLVQKAVPSEDSWNEFDVITDQLDRYDAILRTPLRHLWRRNKLKREIQSHWYASGDRQSRSLRVASDSEPAT
jgi:hypothetical protein